jgi:phage tail-like protein
MAQFSVNANRIDPYKNFKFRVMWDGRYVAGISKVSALKRATEVIPFRNAGDPSSEHRSPGMTRYEPIILERGITHDTDFEVWANMVHNYQGDAAMSLRNFRKDIVIDIFNEAGQKVISYKVHRCWVSEYQALPDLDAAGKAVMIESIKLEHEGWERDTAVKEPKES